MTILGSCLNCGYNNHITANCHYNFKSKCGHCQKWHFSFLCLVGGQKANIEIDKQKPSNQSETNSSKSEGTKVPEVNAGIIWVERTVLQIQLGGESILPTFACTLGGKMVRILKDSGSQSHFICANLAKELNLETIKNNVSLNVNGFNACQEYVTNLVKANLVNNSNECEIQTICVPEIKTKFYLPGLGKVVKEFQNKGYKLADLMLSVNHEIIDQIDIIMGSGEDYFIPQETIIFGGAKPSSYSKTPFGVIMSGSIDRMIENLNELPTYINSDLHNTNVQSNRTEVNLKSQGNNIDLNSSLNQLGKKFTFV